MHYPDWPRQHTVRHLQGWPLARTLDYGVVRLAPSTWRHEHQMAAFWRCYLNRGSGAWLQVGDQRLAIPAGTFFAIPPWHDHACGCDRPVDHAFIHIDLTSVDRSFCQEYWPHPCSVEVAGWSPARLRRTLEHLMDERPDETVIRCQIDSFANAFAATMFQRVPKSPRTRRSLLHDLPDSLQLVCSYIETHLREDLPITRLAELLRMSDGHFSRLFRKHLGTSPTQYILRRRIALAIWLLTNTTDPIEHIAEQCGFHQRSYFSRAFKRLTGRPPSTFRP